MRQLGRYVLEQVLGRGGAGSVHRALLSGPGGFSRPVALKVLHEESGELRREARIGGLLRHQHLVDVYEIGEADGRWFCAMELCPEGSLSGHIPLPPRAVVEVGLQVCEALQYAHEELGLIHLDLKPDNLLLKDGVVKVADLGIARARGFAADRRVRGTPGYMPPEQRAGAPLDARADIYALGVTLVVLATCALPDFTRSRSDRDIANASAPTVSTMYPDAGSDTWTGEEPAEPEEFEEPPESATPAVSGSETLDWDDLTPAAPQPAAASSSLEVAGVPAWLVPVVERCLAESPDGRWQDMAELAEALRALTPSGLGLRETIGWTPPPGPDRRRDTNLPKARDTFVGREAELAELAGALAAPCLVTLKGPAGIGKSRLATAAARGWHEQTGGQAWLCELTQARDLEGLLLAMAGALQLQLGRGDRDAHVEQIGHTLAGRGPAVVVLDNFEQLSQHSGVLARWQSIAGQARLVVTSRQPLNLAGERVLELAPLPEETAQALLVARARQRGAEIADDPDLPALAARLEGLPLALELAAGRLGVLSVREVLDRMGLALLRRGTGDRHGTLQAALDWSWELLDDTERSALAQLSVFAGGFTLEAAEAVLELPAGAGRWVVDVVQSLVEKSLVRRLDGRPLVEPRFGLYTSLQEYAADKLQRGASRPLTPARLHARHGSCYALRGAPSARAALNTHGGVERWWAQSAELDNLVVATRRAAAHGDADAAAGAALAATDILRRRGPSSLAIELLKQASAALEGASAHPGRRGDVLGELGLLLSYEGHLDEARSHYDDALAVHRAAGDRAGEARVLNASGILYMTQSRWEESQRSYEAALAISRAIGARTEEGMARCNLGLVHHKRGQLTEALGHLEAALAIMREVGDRRREAIALGNLGDLDRDLRRETEARGYFEAALALHRTIGNRRSEGLVLNGLGNLYLAQNRFTEAQRAYEAARAIHQEVGNRLGLGGVTGNLGLLFAMQGDLETARGYFEEAVTLHRALNNRAHEGQVLNHLGLTYARTGRPEDARECYEAARTIHLDLGLANQEAIALARLGELHREQGRLEEALACYTEALDARRRAPRPGVEALLTIERGELELELGRPEDARRSMEAAAALDLNDKGKEALQALRQRL